MDNIVDVMGNIVDVKGNSGDHPCGGGHRAHPHLRKSGGVLNSPVVEWLNKGLIAAWSPTCPRRPCP
eukprot:8143734-Pyramimonas_sp.AAC.1